MRKPRWSSEKRLYKNMMENYASLCRRHPTCEAFKQKYEEFKQKFEDAE